MNEYRALKAFTNGNTYVAKGATTSLSDKQAEFLKRGGFIEAVPAVKPAAPEAAKLDAPAAKAAASMVEGPKAPTKAAGKKKDEA